MITFKLLQKLNQFYADHIDPDGIQPTQALRTAIAGIIAIIFYRAMNWSESYWILLSTILIIQTYTGNTPAERYRYLIGTGVVSALCTYVASFIGANAFALALFLMLSTFICLYVSIMNTNIGNVAFYVNFFCLSAGALAVHSKEDWQRLLCVLIGTAIAVIVCACFRPERLSTQILAIIAENLKRLMAFNQALTTHNRNEKAIVIRRNRIVRGLKRARELIPSEAFQDQQMINHIEYLYEIILNIEQLKNYLNEQHVLRLVNRELTMVSRRISWLLRLSLRCLQKKGPLPNYQKFSRAIRQFETLYQRHLGKFNEGQFLAFTMYIDTIFKLNKTTMNLLTSLEKKHVQI